MFDDSPNKNKQEQIDLLKQKKTLFILPPTFNIKDYASILSGVWDISPYEIIWTVDFNKMSADERLDKYPNKDYNYFKLASTKYTRTTKSGAKVDYLFNTMNLNVYKFKKTNKKGYDEYDATSVATIFFTPNIEQRRENPTAKNINPREFINFDLGYLKSYLKVVNSKLKSNGYLNCYNDTYDKVNIKNLQKQKLFIPSSIDVKYNAFSRTEGKKRDKDELLEDYKFPYELITDEELNEKLENDEQIYFLQYTQVNGDKLISVIDSKTNDIIYSSKTGWSYNIKAKDFKAISNKVED
ncbi:hypothetical protein [Flavobacterium capsici]|uniref:Uncharacterized protein n=1 Tax=Flavobacterium capsici TaxID=3075618 RepID=A0AA96EWF6_9FLAO|nr:MULTISPECIES: hypothetical protein [unclassified Flavobacterium]WNM19644.1 hypothetical protein RN608_02915 [Flavobacterium sp. PMR2A8]WNM21033.1 hypothetical protein RN605_10085 [Flavobacterium sp. PMTSA4]